MRFTIRTAVTLDCLSIQGVYQRASLSNDGDRAYLLNSPSSLVWQTDSVKEERTRVAIDADNSLVGFSTYLRTGNEMELIDLFVDPASMRHGIGRALVIDIVTIGVGQSVQNLLVTANPHAAHFYDALGFVKISEVQTMFYPAARMFLDVATCMDGTGIGHGIK